MRTSCILFTAVVLATGCGRPAAGDDLNALLKTLRSVGPKAVGHREARPAWQKLAQCDAATLPVILAGLDGANPLAANWIRTAIDAIAERELRRGGKLPAGELEQFVLDTRHAPRARRLAYEWLCRVDHSAPQRLIPRMLDDPSLELRRDAVARLLDEGDAAAKAENRDRAVSVYREAFLHARDPDQVKRLADRLRKLDQTVDLRRHFGFLVRWKLIGPFDNTEEKGFDAVYPPEREIDLQAEYDGKHGTVKWVDHTTGDDDAEVDLNQVLGKEKAVVGYAMSRFICEEQREVQLRATSVNAVKLWLNGRLVVRRNVYHSGSQMDQFISPVVLQPGRNVILVKVCQNAITPAWADPWGFQLRVCDANGTAVLSADRDR